MFYLGGGRGSKLFRFKDWFPTEIEKSILDLDFDVISEVTDISGKEKKKPFGPNASPLRIFFRHCGIVFMLVQERSKGPPLRFSAL